MSQNKPANNKDTEACRVERPPLLVAGLGRQPTPVCIVISPCPLQTHLSLPWVGVLLDVSVASVSYCYLEEQATQQVCVCWGGVAG